MRIAIITFSDFNTNYGSMLQAFALKTYLENLGHDTTFIKYREYNDDLVKPSNLIQLITGKAKSLVLNGIKFIHRKDIDDCIKNFDSFKQEHFIYTKLYTTNDELKTIDDFDCFIAGSDQIWNVNCLGKICFPYFLDFTSNKSINISYAASFGDYTIPKTDERLYKRLLNNFDRISVREKNSVEMLEKISNKEITNVVDPVFLLSAHEWSDYLDNIPIQGDYAVCYFVRRSALGKKMIKECLQKYKIPIYNLSDNSIYLNGTNSSKISVGPLDFVGLIKNAKYVVGTSFHLAAFATIFEVPFLIAGSEHNKARITNILSLANCENNFIVSEEEINSKLTLLDNTNFTKEKLVRKINDSKKYLEESLGIKK